MKGQHQSAELSYINQLKPSAGMEQVRYAIQDHFGQQQQSDTARG
jgi:hypothetical protein